MDTLTIYTATKLLEQHAYAAGRQDAAQVVRRWWLRLLQEPGNPHLDARAYAIDLTAQLLVEIQALKQAGLISPIPPER